MKRFPLALCLLVVLLASCGKSVRLPKPEESKNKEAIAQKELAKKKNDYIYEITKLEKKHDNLSVSAVEKRSKGYNTSEVESVLILVEKAIGEAKNLLFWEKFDELDLKIGEIKILAKKAENLIKRAPLFGEQDKPKKERVIRKYGLDDREWVRKIRGEPKPGNKRIEPGRSTRLMIPDPTEILNSSICWNPTFRMIVIQVPAVESWWFPEDQTLYIFMETSSTVEQFMLSNDLQARERDRLLAQLCQSASYSGYKLIYVGPPRTDARQIIEQVFTGKGRGADMFGVGALGDLAKATAVLPDLDVVAVAFSTELETLNNLQNEKRKDFEKLLESVAPEILGVVLDLKANDRFDEIYKKAESAKPPLSQQAKMILEKVKEIRNSKDEDGEKRKKIQKLAGSQSKVFRQKLSTVVKVLDWQKTLRVSDGDIKDLTKAFPEVKSHIEKTLLPLKDSLENLVKEFQSIRDSLVRFKNKGIFELVFREGKPPAVFFLLQGVRFDEKKFPDGRSLEKPDLSVRVKVELWISSEDQPSLLYEFPEIKIENANRFIDEVKEFQRLTSFGIRFPTTLVPGNYVITFAVTDNLRVQTVQQTITWLIVPEPES